MGMVDPQMDSAGIQTAVAEQEPEFLMFRFDGDTIWYGGPGISEPVKFRYKNAHKLEKMAKTLHAGGKLGKLSLDDFVLIMLRQEFGKKGEGENATENPILGEMMVVLKKQYSKWQEHLVSIDHTFEKLGIDEAELQTDKYQ